MIFDYRDLDGLMRTFRQLERIHWQHTEDVKDLYLYSVREICGKIKDVQHLTAAVSDAFCEVVANCSPNDPGYQDRFDIRHASKLAV